MRPIAKLVREVWPKAKIVLSAWYFDHFIKDEWEAFAKAIGKDKPDFADYILVDDYGDNFPQYPLKHGLPGHLPMINFPEISMYKMFPWGGYGANPLPKHLQEIWNTCGSRVAGGFPYSEGIFEDLNKAIDLQHYWGDRDAMDTVREYAAYVSSPDAVQEVTAAIEIMEQQHPRWMKGVDKPAQEMRALMFPPEGGPSKVQLISAAPMPRAGECLALIQRAKAKMTPAARAGWRWRILELRAKIDVDIERTKGFNDDASDALYNELEAIYFAQRGEHVVSPPSRQMILRRFIDGKPRAVHARMGL
jgi:hypothetical protein